MYFRGQYNFLSNMYAQPITIHFKSGEVMTFKCVESAFQALKCTSMHEAYQFTKMNGYEAKKQGRRVQLRDKWEEIKLPIMKKLLLIKFSNPVLKAQLLSIHDPIVEDNTWGDKFWGRCNGVGMNHLGKLLMEVRAEIA